MGLAARGGRSCNIIAVALLSTVCALPVLSRDQSRGNLQSERTPQMRTRVTWVEGPDGKRTAVETPVKEMKAVRLIFVGNPAVPVYEGKGSGTNRRISAKTRSWAKAAGWLE